MKNSKKFMRMTTMHALLQSVTMSDLAKATVEAFNAEHSGDIEVDIVKENGFTLRRKKDATITNTDIQDSIRDAIRSLAKENAEDITDFISENYEFEYDDAIITTGFVSDIFDIDRNGRLIYIEVDA